MAFYLHHVPGRLRIQTPQLQSSREAARVACDTIMALNGVCYAHANPVTGSLLIHYDPLQLTPAQLWNVLSEHGLVSGAQSIAENGVTRVTMRKIENGAENEQLLAVAARFAAENLLQHFATALVSALF